MRSLFHTKVNKVNDLTKNDERFSVFYRFRCLGQGFGLEIGQLFVRWRGGSGDRASGLLCGFFAPRCQTLRQVGLDHEQARRQQQRQDSRESQPAGHR